MKPSIDLAVVGISHASAPLCLRESFARVCHQLFKNRSRLTRNSPSVLLSTCNRCELYLPSEGPHLVDALRLLDESELPREWKSHLYIHRERQAFNHLCQVTSGVASAFFGETHIQRQVKIAYSHACEQDLSGDLHYSFQRSLQIARRVRSDLVIDGTQTSLEKLLWEEAESAKSVLFVGASATNEAIIRDFAHRGAEHLTLLSRSQTPRAQRLAQIPTLKQLSWSEIDEWPRYEMIIVATKSPHYLEAFQSAKGRVSTGYIVDLSVPCNITPSVIERGICLHNIDDLKQSLNKRTAALQEKARHAATLIDQLTSRYLERKMSRSLLSRQAVNNICNRAGSFAIDLPLQKEPILSAL